MALDHKFQDQSLIFLQHIKSRSSLNIMKSTLKAKQQRVTWFLLIRLIECKSWDMGWKGHLRLQLEKGLDHWMLLWERNWSFMQMLGLAGVSKELKLLTRMSILLQLERTLKASIQDLSIRSSLVWLKTWRLSPKPHARILTDTHSTTPKIWAERKS